MTTRGFTGNYSSLAVIAGLVRDAATQVGFDPATCYQIETAVDEACSNIIEHAYGGESGNTFEITILPEENRLTVVLRDEGIPFLPPSNIKPNLKKALKDRSNHGLGLYFMQQWMDEIHFERRDNWNVLTMIKNRAA